MNKSELIDKLASDKDLPRRTADQFVNVMFQSMKDALVEGGRIEIRGFGSFKVRHYRGYSGRNPKTGQVIRVMPKRLPVFKVSKLLAASVDKRQ